jgi:AraC family transcriptional regulator
MDRPALHLSPHFERRRLEQLVENCTTFGSARSELHIYETHAQASAIELKFSEPVLTSMISGRKVMHLQGIKAFDYLPGESLLLPGNELMRIDFPDASQANPTKCLALAISPEAIQDTITYLNERMPLVEEEGEWAFLEENFHLLHDQRVVALLNRLIQVFLEGNTAKDIFVDLCLQELLIRLLQTRARNLLLHKYAVCQHSHRMAHVVNFVKENLHANITIKELADKACMSESAFFRSFKNQFGLTPVEFINQERIHKAKQLLRENALSVTEIGFACGFNNMSYFISQFKKQVALTPKKWSQKVSGSRP